MDEPSAGAQYAERFLHGVVQAAAQMQGPVRDQEVVAVTDQRQILEREVGLVQDQQARLAEAKRTRQIRGLTNDDRHLAGRILRSETTLQPRLGRG